MTSEIKNNTISFRLNDENNDKLENLATSYNLQKSSMASNIVVNVLNENLQELIINHISYPRPITKKLFSMLNPDQIDQMIVNLNEYNQGIIKSSMGLFPKNKIIEILQKWMKNSGCQLNITSSQLKINLQVHHEMEKNWSNVTCATTAFILELLDYKVTKTFVDEDWFMIEYSEN